MKTTKDRTRVAVSAFCVFNILLTYSPRPLSLDLQAKDGKYRVVFKNFTHENFDKKFGDSWCMGLVCDDVPEGFKKGKKQYKEMSKRAVPLIIDTMALMLAKLDASVKEPSTKSDW